MDNRFLWVPFYEEFADKLRAFSNDRQALIELIVRVFEKMGVPLPTLERNGKKPTDIDPFTVYALFNKNLTLDKRFARCKAFAEELGMHTPVPESFDGIPLANNQKATFYFFEGNRGEKDIDNLWAVFCSALDYAAVQSAENRARLISYYDSVLKQKGIKWNITMGFYWIRPQFYLSLDGMNRWLLLNGEDDDITAMLAERQLKKLPASIGEKLYKFHKKNTPPNGETYMAFLKEAKKDLALAGYAEFYDFSWAAFEMAVAVNKQNKLKEKDQEDDSENVISEPEPEPTSTPNYWYMAMGEQGSLLESCVEEGVVRLGWDEVGDLRLLKTKDAIRKKWLEETGEELRGGLGMLTTFRDKIAVGDVIFSRQGRHAINGRAVVTSDYAYDSKYGDEGHYHIRQVRWTHQGHWGVKHLLPLATLTTVAEDKIDEIEAMFHDSPPSSPPEVSPYTKEDFLQEVFVDEAEYEVLISLLRNKKNLVLQGPPGVGKTYAAKRLAYAMLGEKDSDRVKMVQFHQSYSYEDFIEGYRPVTAGGFALHHGPFYSFCKEAEANPKQDYIFIIDEINRGNLSKIFGELFMLIEGDKRSESLPLLYSNEPFRVPENVYLIGMMNTADRSLAMLDYALRRRFAFYEFIPAFNSESFKKFQAELANEKLDRLIQTVKMLNMAIAEDAVLGKGFSIGHSYFCHPATGEDAWLQKVVRYELIPLIEEYWFDEPDKVKEWCQTLLQAIQ